MAWMWGIAILYVVLLSVYTAIYIWAPYLWYINYWIYTVLFVEFVERVLCSY